MPAPGPPGEMTTCGPSASGDSLIIDGNCQPLCWYLCSKTGVRRSGYFLYYPSRRQQPATLAALIEALRLQSV